MADVKESYTSVYATLNQRLQYALHQRLRGHTAPASTGKSYAGIASTAKLNQCLQVNQMLDQRLHPH